VRSIISDWLNTLGVVIKSKDAPNGNITAQHYMPIIQKLSTTVYHKMLKYMYGIGEDADYDFEDDPRGLKSKLIQRDVLSKMNQTYGGNTYLWNFVFDPTRVDAVWVSTINLAVADINKKSAGEVLKITPSDGPFIHPKSGAKLSGYHMEVVDKDVINAEQNKADMKKYGLTREKLEDKVKTMAPGYQRKKVAAPAWTDPNYRPGTWGTRSGVEVDKSSYPVGSGHTLLEGMAKEKASE
jgi:hypothetical protein